ncbi:HAMP domain-containing histidine kinase [Opitutales bacterium]|nr:HAMP domain-containing histidine kinase [Opitutales bacterium]MDG1173630.1 HAMP domain-containing sensor histidine kinase [Opitutales bacterium]
MKAPEFENCQVGLNTNGQIFQSSAGFASWVGKKPDEVKGLCLRELLVSLEPSWETILPQFFERAPFECFLPIGGGMEISSMGLAFVFCKYDDLGIASISTALAPHDTLKKAFMGDLMNNPQALASTLIRLQKAESRLSDYISNFPGIFFTQRPDLTFSYLSKGIKTLFPMEHNEFYRNSGLFKDKILEIDRDHFEKELSLHGGKRETFSFSYRFQIPPTNQIIYVLDIRTPIITGTNKLLGYDGVFIDITRQAIAEHRLSNSVWREGLTTLTNGLVHDFSNLMAGIFSISELYFGMMEKDDPMANGMKQIKKSTMQAQKLVRRIIDLHRDKPAARASHDLRDLIKDQMDLIGILLPRSTKLNIRFGKSPLVAFIEETGFRQVILNLIINAKDAIGKNGQIKIVAKSISKGKPILKGFGNTTMFAKAKGTEISIQDNGSGIPEDLTDKIFDPFFTTKETDSGSGFGLYNCKLFVEDHNGEIGFTSKAGKGSTFYIFLPLE